jgi:DnaJ-domain-containing protein 1
MSFNARKTQKFPLLVEAQLADGTSVFGKVFLSSQGRLSDLLNDERDFLPFERADGSFMVLAKSQLRRISPMTTGEEAYKGDDPFKILGLSATATREDIKKAYRDLTMVHHPDRVRGLGFSGEYIELATRNMMRINEAYERALKGQASTAA